MKEAGGEENSCFCGVSHCHEERMCSHILGFVDIVASPGEVSASGGFSADM